MKKINGAGMGRVLFIYLVGVIPRSFLKHLLKCVKKCVIIALTQ